ncbi:hypothetical protein [Alkalisalibacterium limincola]|uniref:Uncharacterized protein n=1 Tax=Alkalisalibacterium limincola TaxID=2699169 RepID=A0A5C8KJW2_9GAMM|nr:hypothetical protein [Alkalisalibacterium limincola]TXK61048.1 hypothetical protein FU658_10790 [Alkalisalibacterium limincola]
MVAAIDHFQVAGPWASVTLILALLAAVAIAGMGRANHRRAAQLAAEASVYAVDSAAKQAAYDALKRELETHKRLEAELTEAKQVAERR